jgi:hypothetical protein
LGALHGLLQAVALFDKDGAIDPPARHRVSMGSSLQGGMVRDRRDSGSTQQPLLDSAQPPHGASSRPVRALLGLGSADNKQTSRSRVINIDTIVERHG